MQSSRLVGSKFIIVNKGMITRNVGVEAQEFLEFKKISDRNKEWAFGTLGFYFGPERRPSIGIAPAVGSSEVTQEDDHRLF